MLFWTNILAATVIADSHKIIYYFAAAKINFHETYEKRQRPAEIAFLEVDWLKINTE